VKYKAVIFDLYGTLIENFPAQTSLENLTKMAEIVGVPPDAFAAEWRKDFAVRMTGTIKDHRACISNICQRLGIKPADVKIDKAASVRFILNQQEVMSSKPDAVDVLKNLKASGYKTALLSNCSMETSKIWPNTELAPLIDVPVMSSVEGIMKPDVRLFKIVLKKLGVEPEACVYVADGVGQELSTASKLGMTAIEIVVPHDSAYEHDRENWQGLKINSLKEIPNLLK
jgi:putative hydrolase of the HAD superfamily